MQTIQLPLSGRFGPWIINRRVQTLAAVALLAVAILSAGCSPDKGGQSMYHCPMHPAVVSDQTGDCSICGMKLVPIEKQTAPGTAGPAAATTPPAPPATGKTVYTCPMHPEVVSGVPGKCAKCGGMELEPRTVDWKTVYICPMHPEVVSGEPGKCPKCGMDLVPRTGGEEPGSPLMEEPAAASSPAGLAPVTVTPEAQRRLGLTFGKVERRPVWRETRTSARIAPDETRLYHITTKIEGWVDTLFVNVTGQHVRQGDPLLTIYSPELVASQQELLTVLAMSRSLRQSPIASVAQGGQDLLAAARQRLRLWDISEAQIARIEESGQLQKFITLYAPASGYVFEKTVVAGHRAMPGEVLMEIADLSRIWGEADIYESDIPYVQIGMMVEIDLPYWPGKIFRGRISFLDPRLDPQTRTMRARLEIANPGLLLKPGMYAGARLKFGLGTRLVVPEDALMRTGERDIVFKKTSGGTLNPVEITVGLRSGNFFEVLSGLREGDEVVTSANFLIDSESSMRAALQAVTGIK